MARAKSNNSRNMSQAGDNMPKMINVYLSDEDKASIKSNVPPMKDMIDWLEEMTSDNYKITISYDDTTDCFSVFLIGKENQVNNAGLMLASYAPSFIGALAVARFKHEVHFDRIWSSKTPANNANSWR